MTEQTDNNGFSQDFLDKRADEMLSKDYENETFYHTVNGLVLDSMNNSFDGIQTSIGNVLADERYSHTHRQQLFDNTVAKNLAKLEKDYAHYSQKLEADIAKLTPLVQYEAPVSETAAPQMIYMKDSLVPRWQTMSLHDMRQQWQTAIESGDKMTARIYRDFANPVMVGKTPTPRGVERTSDPIYEQLAEKTRVLLMTEKQQMQAAKLTAAKATLMRVKMAYSGNKAKLTGATYNRRTGEIKDGARNRIMNQFSW
ncbi:MAG: hypothetical protein AAFQ52_02515 [Chloroflexota bacterium]